MTFYVSIFKECQKLLSTFEFITIQIAEMLWYQMTYERNCYVEVYHSNKQDICSSARVPAECWRDSDYDSSVMIVV